jgi:hypothetical protein
MVGTMSQPQSTPLAIACSLTAAELPERLAEIAALGEAALLDAQVLERRATLRFAAHDGIRPRLEAIIAAEARCCGFMSFDLRDDGAQIVLRIDAPEEAQLVLEEFAATFVPENTAPGLNPRTRRTDS